MWSKFEMKFSEIMESKLNKNFPGDSIENVLSTIQDEFLDQTIKQQIKIIKKDYYSKAKVESLESKWKKITEVHPDSKFDKWTESSFYKSLSNIEKLALLKYSLKQSNWQVKYYKKEFEKQKDQYLKIKKEIEDLKNNSETKLLREKELEKIVLIKNIPRASEYIFENCKDEIFNRKLKSTISTALNLNLIKTTLNFKWIKIPYVKWYKYGGWNNVKYQKSEDVRQDVSYKELSFKLICEPNTDQKEFIKAMKLKKPDSQMKSILNDERMINYLKNFFPIDLLLGKYKDDFDLQKNWYDKLNYEIYSDNNKIIIELIINLENVLRIFAKE
jgi:hypothetical protein